MSINKKQLGCEIVPVCYNPPVDYRLDLEIFPVSVLRQRVSTDFLLTLERIKFNLLLYVTEGQCTHTVGFESICCGSDSLLILHPGQVHCFDVDTDWQGWLVMFRPEFLHPKEAATLLDELEGLPVRISLNKYEQQAVAESITRMYLDSQLEANARILHMLLRNQLNAFLTRIQLIHTRNEQSLPVAPTVLQRFKRYQLAVSRNLHRQHKVSDYAKLLGCSEKSLGRAVQEVAGMSAKAFLSQRIVLEAKRFLAHTGLLVSGIAYKLGFDEAANFIKFFRREEGCSPGEFRRRHTGR